MTISESRTPFIEASSRSAIAKHNTFIQDQGNE